ncbi:MAG: hypothetical protein LBT51_10150 [Fusobacteriaceae bacterium]|jgi:uncharacterized membrane protein|nr:hypothetical protein [Fusobacteriaceae bacterium]
MNIIIIRSVNLIINILLIAGAVAFVDIFMFFYMDRKYGDTLNFSHYKQALKMPLYNGILIKKIIFGILVYIFVGYFRKMFR